MKLYSKLNKVMDDATISKNGESPKSHKSRRCFFTVATLMFLAMSSVYAQISIVPEKMKPPKSNSQRTYYNYLLNFERNLKQSGYTKQITLWDFLPSKGRIGSQAAYIGDRNYAKLATCFIGIWVNFKDELVMFRTNGDIMAEGQVVPFDQIVEVRIKIDAYEETKTRGGGTSVLSGAVGIGSANTRTVSQEKVNGAEVIVVTKGANGVQNYRINVSGRHSVQAIRLV